MKYGLLLEKQKQKTNIYFGHWLFPRTMQIYILDIGAYIFRRIYIQFKI